MTKGGEFWASDSIISKLSYFFDTTDPSPTTSPPAVTIKSDVKNIEKVFKKINKLQMQAKQRRLCIFKLHFRLCSKLCHFHLARLNLNRHWRLCFCRFETVYFASVWMNENLLAFFSICSVLFLMKLKINGSLEADNQQEKIPRILIQGDCILRELIRFLCLMAHQPTWVIC